MYMFSVCISIPRNEKEEDQWSYVLSHWQPSLLYLIGPGIVPYGNNVFKQGVQIDSTASLPKDQPLILLAPLLGRYIQGTELIIDFIHPVNAIYMFGPNNLNLELDSDILQGRSPDHIVYIPVDTHDEMYSWTAAVVTLYDRSAKEAISG